MKWKTKLKVAIGLDVIDFVLGGIGWILDFTGVGATINVIRGIIWDAITTPIIIALFGVKGLAYAGEIPVPDEIDMFVPTATIIAFLSKEIKNKKRK